MQPSQSGQPYDAAHIVERQMLLHETLNKAAQPRPTAQANLRYRFITISRDRGSLGDAVAQDVAARLGWSVYDREIVDHIAQNSHVRQQLVHQLDERDQTLVHETIQRFLGMVEGGSFGIAEYRESLLKTLAYIATRGLAVIVGRGANFALRGEDGGLHVRIVAAPNVRIERLCMRWHVSPEEARWRMEETDLQRRNFIRHHFRQNIDDPVAYDLTYCTDHLMPRQIADSLMGVIAAPPETMRSFG